MLYERQTWKLWSFISIISICTRSIIPYVTPPINNPEKKGYIHDVVIEISKYNLNTGRNVCQYNNIN